MSDLSKSENEIYSLRKEKEQKIKDSKLESFQTSFKNSTPIDFLHREHKDIENGFKTDINASVRGRILSIRSFGKLTFIDLKDETGKIQLVYSDKDISEELIDYLQNLDVGDIVGVSGIIMKTKKGELSIYISNLSLLTKSLRNFPEKWHGLKDKETRFRQRYLDFVVNEDAKNTISTRFNILKNIDMYLRIAPELYLKRLIIGGFEKVFELGKVFRNEGVDQTHSPEFTMMESYEAYTDVNGVMDMVENMCQYVLENLKVDKSIEFNEKVADFSFPWDRKSMFELVNDKFEINVSHDSNLDEVKALLESKYQIESESTTVGELVFDIFENYIEHDIVDPVFVTDYPKEVSPFARESDEKEGITERFELFAFGSELANGFSELIDPVDQENRLKSQAEKKAEGDEEAHVEDSDYIEALEFGLPPTGGLGFGVDRFVMMITNNDSIREVIAFPHLKPEN